MPPKRKTKKADLTPRKRGRGQQQALPEKEGELYSLPTTIRSAPPTNVASAAPEVNNVPLQQAESIEEVELEDEDGQDISSDMGECDGAEEQEGEKDEEEKQSGSPTIPQGTTSARRERKAREVDPNVVSRFQPNEFNIASWTAEDEELLRNDQVQDSIAGETELCVIGLKPGENLVYQGVALIAALVGSVSVYGHTLDGVIPASSQKMSSSTDIQPLIFHPTYSSRTHALLTVEATIRSAMASTASRSESQLKDDAAAERVHLRVIRLWESLLAKRKLANYDQPFDAVFVVRGMSWCGIEEIGLVAPEYRDIFGANTRRRKQTLQKSINIPGFSPILEPAPGLSPIRIPPQWSNVGTHLSSLRSGLRSDRPVVIAVCGTKGLGKSTLSRVLVNMLLSNHGQVAYLDSDIGQSEFGPSGLVGLYRIRSPLLGASFTHPKHAEDCRYFGRSSPRDDPDYYLNCLSELIGAYRENDSWNDANGNLIPLIVNTHGWVKGMGYDLLSAFLRDLCPTHVISINNVQNPSYATGANASNSVNSDFGKMVFSHCEPIDAPESFPLPSFPSSVVPMTYNASDHRALASFSYFYQNAHVQVPSRRGQERQLVAGKRWWNFSKPLSHRRPYVVPMSSLKAWIFGHEISGHELARAVNGTVVGLITEAEPPSTIMEMGENGLGGVTVPPTTAPPLSNPIRILQSPPLPPPRHSCLGLALLRSVDVDLQNYHFLTPVSGNSLSKVTAFVRGSGELPVWCLGHGASRIEDTPYLSVDKVVEGVGAEAKRVRRNLMRKRQIGGGGRKST